MISNSKDLKPGDIIELTRCPDDKTLNIERYRIIGSVLQSIPETYDILISLMVIDRKSGALVDEEAIWGIYLDQTAPILLSSSNSNFKWARS